MSVEKDFSKEPWVSDQGDGTFINPILHADYSDPDVIRVGSDFYMTASSFGHIPGLPILHSKDLINWKIINHAIKRMDLPNYDRPQHGNGVWAPSIRYHDNKYWIFYGDPDVGIFMCTADDPAGQWSPLHLVKAGKGLIDPCPLWDEDGQAYLVHAFARSRCGIKHRLNLCRMSPDGTELLDEGQIVFHDEQRHPTIEGPKLYKRNGYYYIFAPAGGVATGWQVVLRSKSIWGPYEDKVVLHQGDSIVNGPHQGGWVELESGESWFMHFQDKGAYGRITHLQPMKWVEDWPLIGLDSDGDGIGEPVNRYQKPDVGAVYPIEVPESSDHFTAATLGLQWQWQGNPQQEWYELGTRESYIRLHAVPAENGSSLYHMPNLLLQKLNAPSFAAIAKLEGEQLKAGDQAGLIVLGSSYAYMSMMKESSGKHSIRLVHGTDAAEEVKVLCELEEPTLYLQVSVSDGALCRFSYSQDGVNYVPTDDEIFTAQKGHWVGAKLGLFSTHHGINDSAGYADFDYFIIQKNR